ncbi:MAG TPA: LamG-like jellyroll fold domain-containing protein [Leadbetterella sp.]|nr:LamG-like jellyroll fold domain-containing protein [Leadbetterella sp.]
MKLLLFFAFSLSIFKTNAQITPYNNAARNTFFGIGGYSYTQTTFPNGIQAIPYVVSGPSPQNDFSYAVSAVGGINNISGLLRTASINTTMNLKFFGNNVRKFGCRVKSIDQSGLNEGTEDIRLTATTNLGNTASQTGNLFATFIGFNVINENEYITSITAEFVSATATQMITLRDIILGDNTPQNVALNFDGVDDYVSIPNVVNDFSTITDFTVTCWIKPDVSQPSSANNPDENDIISKWAGQGSGTNNNYPFVIRYLNMTQSNIARRGRILVGQWDGTNFTTIVSTTAVNDGQWHHVAFVRQLETFKLFIDGVQEGGDVVDNATGSVNNTTQLQIGRRGNGQNYFRGEIDEVRIWRVAKNATDIANERFCKTPNSTRLEAAFSFSNGVPHDNNTLITQVQDASINLNNGTINNFAKNGDASNFITGQVKYVKLDAPGANNGSSWANAFIQLQSALQASNCNDLFDVFVAKGTHYPDFPTVSNVNLSFNILEGMKVYGGFLGIEKSINKRNLALIYSTNSTILTGDLSNNDTPFNFTTNRGDNSFSVVRVIGSNTVFDGFSVRGARNTGLQINYLSTNNLIKNSKVIDNNFGITTLGNNTSILNCIASGNQQDGLRIEDVALININNCLIANNLNTGVFVTGSSDGRQVNISNCTIVANAANGIGIVNEGGALSYSIKNTISYGNLFTGLAVEINAGILRPDVRNSLIQGETSTDNGNLNGNTTNPQFVSPIANTVQSDAGDYRLKWCSLAINAGTNTGISPLDLDRNPRNFNGTADIGAYEFLGNTPSQVNNSTISGTIDMPIYQGGAIQTISSTAKVLAPAGAIDFKAPNSITLNPGFEARGVGKYFQAQIGANETCVN